jgi:hypothetical protein
MPEVHELKHSLGLTPGEQLGSFVVRDVEVSHSDETMGMISREKERKGGGRQESASGGECGSQECVCVWGRCVVDSFFS